MDNVSRGTVWLKNLGATLTLSESGWDTLALTSDRRPDVRAEQEDRRNESGSNL